MSVANLKKIRRYFWLAMDLEGFFPTSMQWRRYLWRRWVRYQEANRTSIRTSLYGGFSSRRIGQP